MQCWCLEDQKLISHPGSGIARVHLHSVETTLKKSTVALKMLGADFIPKGSTGSIYCQERPNRAKTGSGRRLKYF